MSFSSLRTTRLCGLGGEIQVFNGSLSSVIAAISPQSSLSNKARKDDFAAFGVTMFDTAANDNIIPAPGFPGRDPAAHFGVGFRRFGTTESDLAFDFEAPNRALLVTRLLENCTVDPELRLPEGFYSKLSAGKRVEFLVALAAAGREPALSLVFNCRGCEQEIEIELELAELSELQRDADEFVTVDVDLGHLTAKFRKPRGEDQEVWGEFIAGSDREAVLKMVETLAVDNECVEDLSNAELKAIEEALDEADPLVDFVCQTVCGECGEANDFAIDLVETALAALSRAQYGLVVAIHRLATHYHWSEREIFDIPERRRQQYLELIAASRR